MDGERIAKIAIGIGIIVAFIVMQTGVMMLTEWLAKKAIRKLRDRCKPKEKQWWVDIERQQLNGKKKD